MLRLLGRSEMEALPPRKVGDRWYHAKKSHLLKRPRKGSNTKRQTPQRVFQRKLSLVPELIQTVKAEQPPRNQVVVREGAAQNANAVLLSRWSQNLLMRQNLLSLSRVVKTLISTFYALVIFLGPALPS